MVSLRPVGGAPTRAPITPAPVPAAVTLGPASAAPCTLLVFAVLGSIYCGYNSALEKNDEASSSSKSALSSTKDSPSSPAPFNIKVFGI